MGQKQSNTLPDEKLQDYQLLTHLSEKEILKAYEKFCKLEPDIDTDSFVPAISFERLDEVPEFQVNPFKDRLMLLFTNYSRRCLTFEDYLDMMSVFSEKAPLKLKAEYAFKIYDFDDDDLISRHDLEEILKRLKVMDCCSIDSSDVNEILNKAMSDCDIDEDGYITFTEFSHLVERLQDFPSTFVIRL